VSKDHLPERVKGHKDANATTYSIEQLLIEIHGLWTLAIGIEQPLVVQICGARNDRCCVARDRQIECLPNTLERELEMATRENK
jgi:hypothetical protein